MNRPLHFRFVLGLAPLAAAALLSGCATGEHKSAGPDQAITPTEQFPLLVAETPGQIRLAPHPNGLSPAQRDAIAAMADRWSQDGGGAVTIRVPSAGADRRAADVTSGETAALLHSLGVPEARIHRVGYDPSGDGVAPIIVAYSTFEAVVPRCGLQWENLSTNTKNKPMDNFGCAVSANMAAQIADPADIAGPRDSAPTDAGRRTTVIDAYRQGKATAGAADSSASGTLSSLGSGGSN
ncbi:MAG TPA: CpaD family pilus assembly protein [Caulobacteraceae bacterium]